MKIYINFLMLEKILKNLENLPDIGNESKQNKNILEIIEKYYERI